LPLVAREGQKPHSGCRVAFDAAALFSFPLGGAGSKTGASHRYIVAVYEELDKVTILPVTAYEVSEPR